MCQDLGLKWGEQIESLRLLKNLVSVGDSLSIHSHAALTTLEGLSALTTVGYLRIHNNDALTGLLGLSSLTTVGGVEGYTAIYNNDVLTSLEGLDSLESVGGDLGISYNAALTSLVCPASRLQSVCTSVTTSR